MNVFSIWLRENPTISNNDIENVTELFTRWRHSNRAMGGNWQAEGSVEGPRYRLDDFFIQNLGKRLVVKGGGIDWWEGQIMTMTYTKDGQTFVRSMEDLQNRVKVIYSKIGPNLLTNGDVESGLWTAFGTPASHQTSGCDNSPSAWYARGSCAMYVQTNEANEGTIPASAVAITANQPYMGSVIVNVASGVWTLSLRDEATSSVIGERSTTACGRAWLQATIPETNTYTSVDVNLISTAAQDEVYADGAYLRTSPVRSETEWHEDSDSIDEYGRIEAVHLKGEMTDAEADGFALREVTNNAWPRTRPDRRGGVLMGEAPDDTLIVTCMGMSWTLAWRYATTDGTDDADNHITNLVDESEFFNSTTGTQIIGANTAEVYIESGDPRPVWKCIEKVAEVGDGDTGSGTVWMAGCYPGYVFRYEARPTGTQYRLHRGRLEWYGGGLVPPLEFAPGWCWMADMPAEPQPGPGTSDDDPKRVWLDETWFIYEDGQTRLEWSIDEAL